VIKIQKKTFKRFTSTL